MNLPPTNDTITTKQNKTQSIIVGSVFALTSYILPNNEYFFLSQWQVIYNIQFHMHICILSTEEIHLAFLKTNVLFCRICELSRWEKRDNSQSLHWRHNDHDGVSNHQPHGCLLNRLFRRRSKKTSKLRVTGLCVGNSPGPVSSRTKGQLRGKCFHLMTSSCRHGICWYSLSKFTFACWPQATFVKDVYLEMPGKIAIEKQTDTILLWTQRSSNEIYVLPSVGLITCPLYHVICT